jgi:uncharacterized protein
MAAAIPLCRIVARAISAYLIRMKLPMLLLSLALMTAAPADAQTIAGDWQGTLAVGGATLRLVFHFTPDEKGGFTATFDSPDQGARGIPVASVSLANSSLKLELPTIMASYEGTVNDGAAAIAGSFSQGGMSFPLNLSRPAAVVAVKRVPKPSDIDGDWEGRLNAGGASIRAVFHIVTFEDGMTATMDSPDQGATGVPVGAVRRTGSTLELEMKQIAGGYSGTIDASLTTIDGMWTQGGNSLPLVLTRVRR